MKALRVALLAGFAVFILLQFVRPRIPERTASNELQAPAEVKQVFERHCYSCHSDRRQLVWFDQIVPAYWLVRHDVLQAREHLNFSRIGAKPAAAQRAALFEAVNMMQLGAMPLPRFAAVHPEAKVSAEELATLKAYLAPWAQTANPASATKAAGEHSDVAPAGNHEVVSLDKIAPEPNGLAFDPSFATWKLISITDRGDNNTFRFILGNEIAVKAAQSGNIRPWPDGARFAKIAWQQEPAQDGLIHAGRFVQVELMVKDAQRDKKTLGWGWGRWRGDELKPYGSNANFQGECISCHLPVKGNDSVYTLPITTATVNGEEVANQLAAKLPGGFSEQPLTWSPITLYVDPRSRTTALLLGNDQAVHAIDPHRGKAPDYPPGAELALITWAQRDDPHWFGARIPAQAVVTEFVTVEAAGKSYRRFGGSGTAVQQEAERRDFILGLAPAELP